MHHTFSICSLAPSPRNSSGEFISPNMYIYIYTCTGTSDFQLIFWAGWGIGWGPTREAAPKNGWTVRYISKSIQCALNVPVRIHLGHQRQNWAHDILCFTGYPDWAPHRDLVVTCGLKLWSLVTIWFWTQVRHERFSKIMRLLAYFIVAIGRQQTGIDFEQYAQKKNSFIKHMLRDTGTSHALPQSLYNGGICIVIIISGKE